VTEQPTQGKEITLVARLEDERDAVTALLQDLGVRVRQARSGQEAILLLEDHKSDMVIMDAQLSDMHAWKMLGILKESVEVTSLPIIIIADEQAVMPLPNVTVVVRPVSVATLRNTIFGLFTS